MRGCLGGVNLFCIHINVEWLPRWGAFTFSRMVASVGSGRFVFLPLRQIDTLNSLCQYDAKIFFLSCTNIHLY